MVASQVVDIVPIYPRSWLANNGIGEALASLRAFYVATFNDRFFSEPPPWFTGYMYMEAFVHVPLSVLAVRDLLGAEAATRRTETMAIYLLPFAMQMFVTTFTCLCAMESWGVQRKQLAPLYGMYGPYAALGQSRVSLSSMGSDRLGGGSGATAC